MSYGKLATKAVRELVALVMFLVSARTAALEPGTLTANAASIRRWNIYALMFVNVKHKVKMISDLAHLR